MNEPNGEMSTQPEQETQELTLEEQAKVYADMWKDKGVTVETILQRAQELQQEMTEDERREFTMLIYIPEAVTTRDAWDKVKSENPIWQAYKPGEITIQGETTEKAMVAFAHYSQEPDEDSLGKQAKSTKGWEKTGQEFMSFRLRMIAGEYYRRKEGKQLDEKNYTMCTSGSRSGHGYVPYLYFYSDRDGEVYLNDSLSPRNTSLGVRRVVSQEF